MAIDEIYKMPLSGTWDLDTAATLQKVLTYIHENAVGIQYSNDTPEKIGPGKLIVDNNGGLTFKTPDNTIQTLGNTASVPAFANIIAWVYTDGSASPVILSSYNITSVDRVSLGNYIVNFSVTFSDENYIALITCERIPTEYRVATITDKSATTCSFQVSDLNANLADADYVNILIFGNQEVL